MSWAPEERVFVDLVDDILRSTPGLRYRPTLVEPGDDVDDTGAYAAFHIDASPAHELEVTIELYPDAFRVRVNEDVFAVPVENRRRIEKWIDRRCRDVEQLVNGGS